MSIISKVGRQSIVDRENKIVAYELLYRNSEITEDLSDDELTLDVINTALFKIGYPEISDGVKIAVNFSSSQLLDNVSEVVSPNHMVLEILEDVELDDAFIKRIAEYKKRGFSIALDDFKIDSVINEEVYNYVDVIKVDFRDTCSVEKKAIEEIPCRYSNVSLLAEKIETDKEYDYAMNNGYSLFQGYYISKPEVMCHYDVQ